MSLTRIFVFRFKFFSFFTIHTNLTTGDLGNVENNAAEALKQRQSMFVILKIQIFDSSVTRCERHRTTHSLSFFFRNCLTAHLLRFTFGACCICSSFVASKRIRFAIRFDFRIVVSFVLVSMLSVIGARKKHTKFSVIVMKKY